MRVNFYYLLSLVFIFPSLQGRAIVEENISDYQVNSISISIPNYEKFSTLSEATLHTELAKVQKEKEAAAAILHRRKLEETDLSSAHEKERLKLQQLEAQRKHAEEEAIHAEEALRLKENEEKALIEALGTIEEARFILKLQSSSNPRIKDSVETYKSFFSIFKEFEAQYSPILTLEELLTTEVFERLSPENVLELGRIYKRLNEILNDSAQKARLFEILFATQRKEEKNSAIISLINLGNTSLMPIEIPTYTFHEPIIIQDTNSFINYLLDKASDILTSFTFKLLEEFNPVLRKGIKIQTASWNSPFYTFTPDGRNGNSPWKMHISGQNFMAWKVFKYVLPYMVKNKRYFKVYHDIKDLHSFYYEGSLPQTGKFFTVYPKDDAESTELARDLNDLMGITGFDPSNFPAVPNDVKVGRAVGVYGRYEGHSLNKYYDRLVPWGDQLNKDRTATCPFVQDGINIRWEKDGTVLIESWDKRPTTWAKFKNYIPNLTAYQSELNDEDKRIIAETPER